MAAFPIIRTWTDNVRYGSLDAIPFHLELYKVYQMQPHRHEYLELALVLEGENKQVINGIEYPLKPGTMTLLLPYQTHEMPYSPKPVRLFNCMFEPDFLFRAPSGDSGLRQMLFTSDELVPTLQLPEEVFQTIRALFDDMLSEYNDSGEPKWRDDLLQLKLLELLIRFDRLRCGRTIPTAPPAGLAAKRQRARTAGNTRTGSQASDSAAQLPLEELPSHADTPIWAIIRYVHANYREPLTLASLAEQFGMSRPYVSAAFKRYTGCNFVRFLHEVRIRHACALLTSSHMSGADIAAEVGFSCFKSYSRIFREVKGTTPSEYRKQFARPLFAAQKR